jgi:heme-degrading monooxygenase HmoA
MEENQQTTTAGDGEHITLINVFTCAQERQHDLVEALDKATAELFAHQPGFISASIHASLDQTRVVNYTQWRRVEDFDALGRVPAVQEQMAGIMTLTQSADPRLYTVRAVHPAASGEASSGSGSS